MEGVYSVVLRRFAAGVMYSATGNDKNVRSFADIKIIVNEIVYARFRNDNGYIDTLAFGERFDNYIYAGNVCFRDDIYICRDRTR